MNIQHAVTYVTSLFALLIGLLLITNPVVGYSRLLPGGIFELVFGGLLLSSGVLLYQIGASTLSTE
jgi:hypothetical protein